MEIKKKICPNCGTKMDIAYNYKGEEISVCPKCSFPTKNCPRCDRPMKKIILGMGNKKYVCPDCNYEEEYKHPWLR
jgi:DNA-directed RNA polymerase subunit RPC12/RpoP